MTEEEYFRKNNPDYCYGERPLSPYWDLFQDGVEFSERQSEKEIANLKETNAILSESATINRKDIEYKISVIEQRNKRIAELEQQIEKMKCCENCKFKDCDKSNSYQTCWYCKNKDKWELEND